MCINNINAIILVLYMYVGGVRARVVCLLCIWSDHLSRSKRRTFAIAIIRTAWTLTLHVIYAHAPDVSRCFCSAWTYQCTVPCRLLGHFKMDQIAMVFTKAVQAQSPWRHSWWICSANHQPKLMEFYFILPWIINSRKVNEPLLRDTSRRDFVVVE